MSTDERIGAPAAVLENHGDSSSERTVTAAEGGQVQWNLEEATINSPCTVKYFTDIIDKHVKEVTVPVTSVTAGTTRMFLLT